MKQYLKIRAGTRDYRVLAGALHWISLHMRMYFRIQILIQHYHVATIMQFICFMATKQQQFVKTLDVKSLRTSGSYISYNTLSVSVQNFPMQWFTTFDYQGHVMFLADWEYHNSPKYVLTCANLQCVGLGEHTQTTPAIKPMHSASTSVRWGL